MDETLLHLKEYGIGGIVAFVAVKYGSPIVTFVLEQLGFRLTRRATVEDRVAALSEEIATLRGNYESLASMVAEAATAMDEEMIATGIENRVLRVFVERLKRVNLVRSAPLIITPSSS